MHSYYVRVVYTFESHDFSLDRFAFHGVVKLLFLVDFDCVLLLRRLVNALIHNCICSLAYRLTNYIIVQYSFTYTQIGLRWVLYLIVLNFLWSHINARVRCLMTLIHGSTHVTAASFVVVERVEHSCLSRPFNSSFRSIHSRWFSTTNTFPWWLLVRIDCWDGSGFVNTSVWIVGRFTSRLRQQIICCTVGPSGSTGLNSRFFTSCTRKHVNVQPLVRHEDVDVPGNSTCGPVEVGSGSSSMSCRYPTRVLPLSSWVVINANWLNLILIGSTGYHVLRFSCRRLDESWFA